MNIEPHLAFLRRQPDELKLKDFRDFFASIPEENWCVGTYGGIHKGACCAQGHLNRGGSLGNGVEAIMPAPGYAFVERLRKLVGFSIIDINDGCYETDPKASTPKRRILQRLDQAMEVR